MKIGTRSVLYGAHCFLIHPVCVFAAWWKLYGFPWDPRIWIACFVHDLGYLGKPNMDGVEGEQHPELGARFMRYFFGAEWYSFCRYHSRHLAKKDGVAFSRLCVADKYAIVMTPRWFYLPFVWITGELDEYMEIASAGEVDIATNSATEWYDDVQAYMDRWVAEHKDGRADTWTAATRHTKREEG